MTIEIGGSSGGGGGDNGGGSGGAKIRRRGRPSTFLPKTFQMVNDPNTDSIISWSESGDSFIIWDHIKFTAEILPNYFRHNNLLSFVRQLNNFGFRKIGVDHEWEYANKDFQKGKQHLLLNMSKISLQHPTRQRHRRSRHCDDEDDDDDNDEGRATKREKVVVAVISDDDHEGGHVANREKEKVTVSVETASGSDESLDEEDHQNKVVKENEGDHVTKSKLVDIIVLE